MEVVFNIVIIALVLLIAYWWANQGLFSAILHLLCVIAAGAIAFGLWNWVTISFLLSGGGFDGFAWGVTLIGIFVVSLLILRVAFDRLAPGNVDLPHWANLAFGGACGGAAGVLTIGIFVIGTGFVQSTTEIMGFAGYARNKANGEVEKMDTMWLPVHELTEQFYAFMSVNALSTETPMMQFAPDLAAQAVSLNRDTYKDGRQGRYAMPADAARIIAWNVEEGTCSVEINFNSEARDFAEQLILSKSQVRIIERVSGRRSPRVEHPVQWYQDGLGPYKFDNVGHFATSTAGQQNATILLQFRVPGNFNPGLIQIKNIPYELRRAQEGPTSRGVPIITPVGATDGPIAAQNIQSVIEVNNSTRPIVSDPNRLPSGISYIEHSFDNGRAFFPSSGDRPQRDMRIDMVYATPGTRIVQVTVNIGGPADIFGPVRTVVEETAQIRLIDAGNREYPCMGFLHQRSNGNTLAIDRRGYTDTYAKLPTLPSSGTETMRLLFAVTDGVTITKLNVGEHTIGTCNLLVAVSRAP